MSRYALGVIKYPNGKFGFVGRVPVELAGRVWDTEVAALQEAENLGHEVLQGADCMPFPNLPGRLTEQDIIDRGEKS